MSLELSFALRRALHSTGSNFCTSNNVIELLPLQDENSTYHSRKVMMSGCIDHQIEAEEESV